MDSGLAVVYGASIALVGSAIIPWFRESSTQWLERRRQYRTDLREAVRDALQGLNEMYYEYGKKTKAEDAIRQQMQGQWLSMIVRKQDRPVSFLVDLVSSNLIEEDEHVRLASIKAISDVLPLWFRRECKTKDLVHKYERNYSAWLHFHRDLDRAAEEVPPKG